jgi:hypothetical protein
VHVGPLTRAEVAQALTNGLTKAAEFRARGLIHSAALFLNSTARILGPLPLLEPIHA